MQILVALALLASMTVTAASSATPRKTRACARRSRTCAHKTAACPSSVSQVPNSSSQAQAAADVLCLINRARAAAGEAALANNPHLDSAAQGHTQNMIDDDFFDHTGPDGETLLQRAIAAGYTTRASNYLLGENIAVAIDSDATPAAIVDAWLASPEHRANILDRSFRDSGIGVVASVPSLYGSDDPGATYTQDFGVTNGH